MVSAGDLIGASPLMSALFHDEPTIEAMNQIGLDITAVGNHEFDEGADELRRMQTAAATRSTAATTATRSRGADFQFLAANVRRPRRPAKPVPGLPSASVRASRSPSSA